MHVINCPSVPYWGHIPDGVRPGTTIHIDGFVPHHCSKLEVNLMCGNEVGHHAEKHSNIALNLRPKLHGKKIICNSRQYGSWGHKEKHRNIHVFHHGSNFNITIIAEHQYYRIICNGQHVCNFSHRLPTHEVRVLNIEGHVDISRIEYRHGQYQGVVPSAPYPSVPYPSAPVYPPQQVYPATYPAPPPPAYIPAPVVQPIVQPVVQPVPYVAPTVVIEERHHGHHHHHGLIDTLFGHHGHHHHGHHGHHHHHHW